MAARSPDSNGGSKTRTLSFAASATYSQPFESNLTADGACILLSESPGSMASKLD